MPFIGSKLEDIGQQDIDDLISTQERERLWDEK
jgi:hypothetical protein